MGHSRRTNVLETAWWRQTSGSTRPSPKPMRVGWSTVVRAGLAARSTVFVPPKCPDLKCPSWGIAASKRVREIRPTSANCGGTAKHLVRIWSLDVPRFWSIFDQKHGEIRWFPVQKSQFWSKMVIFNHKNPSYSVFLIKNGPKKRDIEGPNSHQMFCCTLEAGAEFLGNRANWVALLES